MEITQNIKDFPIAIYFIDPVSEEDCKEYYKEIKKPMWLNKVISKLEKNEYKTPDEWKKDMKLIWENASQFNIKRNWLIYYIAAELNSIFKSMSNDIPATPYQAWTKKLEIEQNKLNQLLNTFPGHFIPVEREKTKEVARSSSKAKL